MFFLDKKRVPAVAAAGRVDEEKGKKSFSSLAHSDLFGRIIWPIYLRKLVGSALHFLASRLEAESVILY